METRRAGLPLIAKEDEMKLADLFAASWSATMPSWITMMVAQDALDLNPPGGGGYKPPTWTTNAELLAVHERCVADAKAVLAGASDAKLDEPWRLLVAGRVVSETPRHVSIEDTFAHLAHHRGQLTVYLRLNGVAVPSVYGPSADDKTF